MNESMIYRKKRLSVYTNNIIERVRWGQRHNILFFYFFFF